MDKFDMPSPLEEGQYEEFRQLRKAFAEAATAVCTWLEEYKARTGDEPSLGGPLDAAAMNEFRDIRNVMIMAEEAGGEELQAAQSAMATYAQELNLLRIAQAAIFAIK